jgi:hypothetical protein
VHLVGIGARGEKADHHGIGGGFEGADAARRMNDTKLSGDGERRRQEDQQK